MLTVSLPRSEKEPLVDAANLRHPSVVTGKKSADRGRLRDGSDYDVVLLDDSHIGLSVHLQKVVYNHLSPQDKPFITYKNPEDFARHNAFGHQMIGAIYEGRLIAQSLIILPSVQHPDTSVQGMELPAAPQDIAVISGMIVDPEFRGNKIPRMLTKASIAFAHAVRRKHMISDVCVDNTASWMTFMERGMSISGIGADPYISPKTVYFMHAPLEPLMRGELKDAFAKASAVYTPFDDIRKQENLLANGYLGVVYDPADRSIGFKKAHR